MKLLNQEQLPGLASQPAYIQEWMATTAASLASDPNGKHNSQAEYFAYTSDLKSFANYLATHFNGETLRFVMYHPYIFHWAAGVPYGKPFAVAQRIGIFDHIATLLKQKQYTRDKIEKLFTDKFSQRNLWGENVLHSAVASTDISDTETAEFMKKLLNYVVCDKLPTLLLSKNNGGITVLDYAMLRGKPQTLCVLTDALAYIIGPKTWTMRYQASGVAGAKVLGTNPWIDFSGTAPRLRD